MRVAHERTTELLRYLAVGGTSAIFYVLFSVAFTGILGFRPGLAVIAALIILVPPTYLAQRRLAFRSRQSHAAAFPRYIGAMAGGNALAVLLSEAFSGAVRQSPWLGFILLACVVAAFNYAALSLWAFRRKA